MSAERMPASAIIRPRGLRIEAMNAPLGAGWLSSGVPEIGTKGTTNG